MTPRISAAALLLTLSACTTMTAAPPAQRTIPVSAGTTNPSEALRALFAQSDAASLRRNPISALGRGDYENAHRLGNSYSNDYDEAERVAAQADLAALRAIDRSALNPTDRLAYDVFGYQRELDLSRLEPALRALTRVRPINHFSGVHSDYPILASGRSIAPFRNVDDYEDNLSRHRQWGAMVDRIIVRFREGLSSGVVDTKLTVRNMIEQIDNLLRETPEDSTFTGPIRTFPEGVTMAERERLKAAHLASLKDDIRPAYQRLRDFLRNDYLPRARDGAGLVHMQGGDLLYRRLILENTTLPLEADAVHQLGLREVARIRAEMETVKQRTGFTGTLKQFFDHLRTEPRFTPATREWLRDRYYAIGRQVDEKIGTLFSHTPRSKLEIREVEAFRERGEAAG